MNNLQIRLPDEELQDLDELARSLHMSRSEAARNAIHEGLVKMRMEIALQRYLRKEFTLARAAAYAGVSLQIMAEFMAKNGVEYYRYFPGEVDVDAAKVADWLSE